MQGSDRREMCPRCGSAVLKRWDELGDDQKFLAERLPASAEYSERERRKHRFCARCWFEEVPRRETTAWGISGV